jgi:hypothetical protein
MRKTKPDLQDAIRSLHGCESEFLTSVPVHLTHDGKSAWEGVVEVFKLIRHPKAKHCLAWSYEDGNETKVTAVLEIPPVDSAGSAVAVAIAAKARE